MLLTLATSIPVALIPVTALSDPATANLPGLDLGGSEYRSMVSEEDQRDAAAHDPSLGAPMVIGTEVVAQLTGPGSANATDARWNVYGTDLGHMFRHNGDLYMVFGDTYGPDGGDWRSNTIARIADPNPQNGLPFAAMIEGDAGDAKELVQASRLPGVEWTVIPTNGISVGDRIILHYMSVRMWAADNRWYVGRSGLAYSDDDGQTWTRSKTARWGAGTGFEQVAFVESGGMVYVFGIPQGRFGDVRLGRVAPEGLLDPAAYTYWNGEVWIDDIRRAAQVVPAPAGELSVAWSETHQRWLMMYLDPSRKAVVLRSSPDLTGPWSDAEDVATAAEYPGLYAPYIVPGAAIGDDLYFTMSRWKPLYNVFLMKARLDQAPGLLASIEPGPDPQSLIE